MAINRASLPEEFYDRTSAQLLAQPEPQYLYAQMFLRALNIDLVPPTEIGRPGYTLTGQGADYNPQDNLKLADAMSSAVFAVQANFLGEPGHILKFNRPQFTDTTYTQAAREIGTNQTISTVAITTGSEQAFLQIKRFAGPYDQTNTRVAPIGVDAFDANLGVHNLVKYAGAQLSRDFHKTIDSFWVTLADLASVTVRPYGMNADNDATTKGQFPLTYETISRTAKIQDEANLPRLGDGKRILVCTPTGKKQLIDDPQFAAYTKNMVQLNPLMAGWFGTTPDYHCFQSNTLTKTANSSSVNIHNAHAIAPGALLGGIGKPPMVVAASDDNYGQTPKVIWLAHLALGLADNRFITKISYSEDVS